MPSVYADRFHNRRAIVTGGASGIGLDIATRLAAEGAAVALWDMQEGALATAKGQTGAAHTAALDVTEEQAVDRAMAGTIGALGGEIDILVASAGITGPDGPVKDYPAETWRRVIDVNLNGLFLCNRAAISTMERNGYGRIVNIASIAGKEGNANAAAYSVSKAGVICLTKALSKELVTTPIRVNCVTPAAVRTPLFAQMSEAHIAAMLSKIPLRRFGEVAEITALVCWLASEECSFSTGAAFDISGGRATY